MGHHSPSVQGELPNLAFIIKNAVHGKLRTVSAPNCPRVYCTLFTSTPPEEHGVTGFIVGGITANTNMLKQFCARRNFLRSRAGTPSIPWR
jgi:predicted AlkP superfamily phosphohydrolase/phosphomutase